MMNWCEWCASTERGKDGKVIHTNTCALRPVYVSPFPTIPENHYCSKCRSNYVGTASDHFWDCVYEKGCPSCKAKYLDKYHAENCKRAEAWKRVEEAPPSTALEMISYKKPAEASSLESHFYTADAVTGLAPNGRWASKPFDPQWITIDLGEEFLIDRVVLDWEHAYAKEYDIQISLDLVLWDVVYSTSNGRGMLENIVFPETRGRYVRMYGRQRATRWGYSLWAFRVYGKSDDESQPIAERLKKKWSKTLPQGDILIIDERKVP